MALAVELREGSFFRRAEYYLANAGIFGDYFQRNFGLNT
jgi:hypothetical protein